MSTERPILNPPPKVRFQKQNGWIKAHQSLVDSDEFDRAVTFALLQYQRELAAAPLNEAGACHMKMVGVQEFLRTLIYLSEAPNNTKAPVIQGLDFESTK